MSLRSILMRSPKKNKTKKQLKFKSENDILIIPSNADNKYREKMLVVQQKLNQLINDMGDIMKDQNQQNQKTNMKIKQLVKSVDYVLKRSKSSRWGSKGGTKRRHRK